MASEKLAQKKNQHSRRHYYRHIPMSEDIDNEEFTTSMNQLDGVSSDDEDEEDDEESEALIVVNDSQTQSSNVSDLTNSQSSGFTIIPNQKKRKTRTSPIWLHFTDVDVILPGNFGHFYLTI